MNLFIRVSSLSFRYCSIETYYEIASVGGNLVLTKRIVITQRIRFVCNGATMKIYRIRFAKRGTVPAESNEGLFNSELRFITTIYFLRLSQFSELQKIFNRSVRT